jgi:hypothetical protein
MHRCTRLRVGTRPAFLAIARSDLMVDRWPGQAWQQRGSERAQTEMVELVDTEAAH